LRTALPLCIMTLVALGMPAYGAASISQILLESEQRLGFQSALDSEKDALHGIDIELKRADFSRAIELRGEGILSAKDLDKARAEYEKALIKFGASRHKLKQTLKEVKVQRKLIAEHLRRIESIAKRSSPGDL
jgi:multidrug resistance efflux pump